LKEIAFIKNNQAYWEDFESYLDGRKDIDSDTLAQLYIHITDDLSYAKTFYPKSKVVSYLNGLAFKAHGKIYKNKKEKKSRFIDFWKYEVPEAVYNARKEMMYSLLIFLVAIAIGLFSQAQNQDFIRYIIGDSYVNMTDDNIEKGDPMGVYRSSGQGSMFVGISTNNVRVSFLAYAFGILGSVPSAWIIFSNGIMVGCFLGFFVGRGLTWIAISTIFIHGALELSAIVIAGAAGLVLGNSFLFPGTYSRKVSLIRGAKRSLKIIIGLVPVFIVAAILESFVTRHYMGMGSWARIAIVTLSFAFIIWYFIYYPKKLYENGSYQTTSNAED